MARWRDVETAEPELARLVRARFEAAKHSTLATLRREGAPRISGTEVRFEDGELWIESMPDARKALDLRRDPRLALHSPSEDPPEDDPSAWSGDAKVAGTAVETRPYLFRIEVTEVVLIRVGDPADHLTIETWHPDRGREVVLRR